MLRYAVVLLPDFRFFAPNPASFDYVLRVYIQNSDNATSNAAIAAPRRQLVSEVRYDEPSPLGFAWNPPAREQKIFRDEVDGLLAALARARDAKNTSLPDWAVVSDSYLTCLAISAAEISTRDRVVTVVQFEVVSITAEIENVVLTSRWHTISGLNQRALT